MAENKITFDNLEIGLSQPAIHALHGAGVLRLEELAGWREKEIAALHGMGPKGMSALKAALRDRGLGFAGGEVLEGRANA